MTLKKDPNFKENLTFYLENDIRNLVNFNPTTQKPKNFTLIGYFYPKYMRFELKRGGVIFHEELFFMTLNSDAKLE